jgi:hypothetical protein
MYIVRIYIEDIEIWCSEGIYLCEQRARERVVKLAGQGYCAQMIVCESNLYKNIYDIITRGKVGAVSAV